MQTKRGDFKGFGARVIDASTVMFTFAVMDGCKNAAIKLFNKDSFQLNMTLFLEDNYRIGNVYSVEVTDLDFDNMCYLLVEDDNAYVDRYAKVIYGRDIWSQESRIEVEYKVYGGFERENPAWDDNPVKIAPKDMIMYKLHMRGFTKGNSSAKIAGTYKALLKKLPELKMLGVTSLEFQPLYDFEEIFYAYRPYIDKDGKRKTAIDALNKTNYWGYGDAFYFAPKASYFGGASKSVNALKETVSAVHFQQMEVIMEMSFSEQVSSEYILDCLHYYVMEYHVDGFHLIGLNVPVERLVNDALLKDTKIFCESIPEHILASEKGNKHLFIYNDSFMYVMRQIQNHMNGSLVQFANHMRRQNDGYGFVNYPATISGFTLWDSYSYGEKHNALNGEENRDGTNINCSFNCGIEGKSSNRAVNDLRFLSMRNAFAISVLSQGIPMILAGDEMANSAEGNNNPYCQDNKIGWTVFSKTKDKVLLKNFVTQIIDFRKAHQCIHQENAMEMSDYKHVGYPDLSYHGSEPWMMSIGEEQKAMGILYSGAYSNEEEDVYICFNFHYDDVYLALPLLASGKRWRQVVNTKTYHEGCSFEPKPIHDQQSIRVPSNSVSVLVGVRP